MRSTALSTLPTMALLAMVTLVANAQTASTVKGKVKSIADDKSSFVVTPKGGEDVTVKVNADTKYSLDKKDSTLDDAVKVGNRITATVNADGLATEVAARTPKPAATAPAAQ